MSQSSESQPLLAGSGGNLQQANRASSSSHYSISHHHYDNDGDDDNNNDGATPPPSVVIATASSSGSLNKKKKKRLRNPIPTMEDLDRLRDDDHALRKPNAEDEAGLFSSVTYTWFAETVERAIVADLPRGEVLPVSASDGATDVASRFWHEFETELAKESRWNRFVPELWKKTLWKDQLDGSNSSNNHDSSDNNNKNKSSSMQEEASALPYVPVIRRADGAKGTLLWVGKLLQDEHDKSVTRATLASASSTIRAAVHWRVKLPPPPVSSSSAAAAAPAPAAKKRDSSSSMGTTPVSPSQHPFENFSMTRESCGTLSAAVAAAADASKMNNTKNSSSNNNSNKSQPTSAPGAGGEPPELVVMDGKVNSEDLVGMLDPRPQDGGSLITAVSVEAIDLDFAEAKNYPTPTKASVWWAVVRSLSGPWFLALVPRFLSESAYLVSPYLLELYTGYLHDKDADWRTGAEISAALLVTYLTLSLSSQKWVQLAVRSGLRIRSALMLCVLFRALSLSQKGQSHPTASVGRIVTLAGSDVNMVNNSTTYLIYVLTLPFQLTIVIWLIYRLLGWIAFVALGMTLLFIPLSAAVLRKMSQKRESMTAATDGRAKMTSELFSSMRVIKCSCLEQSFLKSLCAVRDTEIAALGDMQIYRVITSFISSVAPAVVMGVCLVIYATMHELSAQVLFPSMALLNILRGFAMVVPYALTITMDLNVSLKRLRTFFTNDSMAPYIEVVVDGEQGEEGADNNNNSSSTNKKPSSSPQSAANKNSRDAMMISTNMMCALAFEAKEIDQELEEGYGAALKAYEQQQDAQAGCCTAFLCGCCGCCNACCGLSCCGRPRFFQQRGCCTMCFKSKKEEAVSAVPVAKKETTDNNNNNNNDKKQATQKKKKDSVLALTAKRVLENVTVTFPRGKCTFIIGATGASKTQLIEALLGFSHTFVAPTTKATKTPTSTATTKINGAANEDESSSVYWKMMGHTAAADGGGFAIPTVAYVPQASWLCNTTVRENIIFHADSNSSNNNNNDGRQMTPEQQERLLQRAIDVCELRPDLEVLPRGLETTVGSKGLQLSGGQKSRVQLARAVYADADIYVLDDVLSALDATTGENVFKKCIMGSLGNKTRIMVTHHVHYLSYAHHIVQLDGGRVVFAGDFADYSNQLSSGMIRDLSSETFSADPASRSGLMATSTPATATSMSKSGLKALFPAGNVAAATAGAESSTKKMGIEATAAVSSSDDDDDADIAKGEVVAAAEAETSKPVAATATVAAATGDGGAEEEEISQGAVKTETFKAYFIAAGGTSRFAFILLWWLISEVLNQAQVVWLTLWAGKMWNLSPNTYLYIYVSTVALSLISASTRAYILLETGRIASRSLHFQLLTSLMSARCSFFDTTPLGRVLNRFSSDIDTIDNYLPMDLLSLLTTLFSMMSSFAIMFASTPLLLVIVVPASFFYFSVMRMFNCAVREIKRIDSVNKSPIFAAISEVVDGIKTILTYNKSSSVLRQTAQRIDAFFSSSYALAIVNRWLGVRLELLGNFIVVCVAVLGVLTKTFSGKLALNGEQTSGLVALGLTLSMSVVGQLNWLVRMRAQVESDGNNLERLLNYCNNVEQEDVILPEMVPDNYRELFTEMMPDRRARQQEMAAKALLVEREARRKELKEEEEEEEAARQQQQHASSSSQAEASDSSSANPNNNSSGWAETATTTTTTTTTRGGAGVQLQNNGGASIELRNVSMRYRAGLPLAVRHVSFKIAAGEKVALCGRSGSAKSSLLNIFLRLAEICEDGDYLVDGRNTREMTLPELREKFCLIPQTPTLFNGTLRYNLDCFDECTDAELEAAIIAVGLEERLLHAPPTQQQQTTATLEAADDQTKSQEQQVQEDECTVTDGGAADVQVDGRSNHQDDDDEGNTRHQRQQQQMLIKSRRVLGDRLPIAVALAAPISDGASNLSVGERQQLQLARALTRKKAPIVCLDECSASLSHEADAVIQKTIRSAFSDRTVVTIAHRLNSVAYCDKIVVMDRGQVAQEGHPKQLLLDKSGPFYQLVSAQGGKAMRAFEKHVRKYHGE